MIAEADAPLRLGVSACLLAHHLRRHEVSYLAGQVYLCPHPAELMLRHHV